MPLQSDLIAADAQSGEEAVVPSNLDLRPLKFTNVGSAAGSRHGVPPPHLPVDRRVIERPITQVR
jgi:hypothetical protein